MTRKVWIPSVLDIEKDEHGVLRMPFNTIDYGEHNHILRLCYECGKQYPQGEMKELSCFENEGKTEHQDRIYTDDFTFFASSIYYCKECWFNTDISDASMWSG